MTYEEVISLSKEDDRFKSDWLDGYEQGRADERKKKMTIDEAIKYTRKVAEEYEQLADWLEELKIFQELYPDSDVRGSLEINYINGYNQALEDMQKGIKEILEDNEIYNIDCVDTLVKQLSK